MIHDITPMHCGTLLVDKGRILTLGIDEDKIVATPSVSFLVEGESDREPTLVDTSFGDVDLMNERWPEYPSRRPPNRTITDQLDQRGYSPSDIETIVLTHVDWDHCYNLDLFDNADIYVQRSEINDRYPNGFNKDWDPPWADVEINLLDGETELAPGIVAFPTPGHSIGHQSVEVQTNEGTTVIAGDAIVTFDNIDNQTGEPAVRGVAFHDDDEWLQSAKELIERADHILPGHEWRILDVEQPDDATV